MREICEENIILSLLCLDNLRVVRSENKIVSFDPYPLIEIILIMLFIL